MNRLYLPVLLLSVIYVGLTIGRPHARRGPPEPHPQEGDSPENKDVDTGLAYDKYLRQVVEVLESDPEFRKKLETANVSDIKSGKIAMHLEMVNHTVRTKLDEIKRTEVTRLRDLARMQMEAAQAGRGHPGGKPLDIPQHLDVRNPHSFEMKDLEQLIKQTTNDLEEMDKKRKEDFKEYEMEKQYQQKQHLKEMDEEARKKEEARLAELKKKHAQHPKVNHPGSKDQFEEVWNEADHLEDQEFNPKTFFFKHDINGDMEWSIDEVDAVLQIELDKVYDAKNSPDEDDPREREEEMARMREHVFQEMDKDKNYRIAFDEFIAYTGQQGDNEEFQKDEGWKTVDEEPYFDDEDYQNYLNSHHAQQPGMVDHPGNLEFSPEQHQQMQQQQFQQQQFQQQQQQFQQQNQQQFQQQQQHNQQQFQQPPHPNQQQFQQPPHPNQQQQFNQPPGGQPQPGNPPAGHPVNQQNIPPVNQQQQQPPNPNVVNMNQQHPDDQQKLQDQLKELQAKLEQQQKAGQQQQQQQQQQQHKELPNTVV